MKRTASSFNKHRTPCQANLREYNPKAYMPIKQQFTIVNTNKILTISGITILLSVLISLTSCNEDKESNLYLEPQNLAVSSFSLKSGVGSQELDSVFFSIDLERGLIFNADSLRKGTDISKVVANIRFRGAVSGAIIVMNGGKVREGEIDYRSNPNDSIDFTGNVTLNVKADDNKIATSYRIKVNVHNVDSDTLFWDKTARAELPSRLPDPKAQKTVKSGDTVYTLINESDDSYTMSTTESLQAFNWHKTAITFGFRPQVETLTATDDALYILDNQGGLHFKKLDSTSWQSTTEVWISMIGSYTGTVIGLKNLNGETVYTQYPEKDILSTKIAEDFPVVSGSNLVTLTNKWTSSPVAFFVGGRTADGKISDSTWAFDGTNWIKMSVGGIPALEGASVIPYYNYRPSAQGNSMIEYNVWMLIGGKKADGEFNRTVYVSYDNGVNWATGTSSLQLPPDMPAMEGCDNLVIDTPMDAQISDMWKASSRPTRVHYELDGNVIRWGCPYIYLFGGYAPNGSLYNTIWKGVLSRLTFTPII